MKKRQNPAVRVTADRRKNIEKSGGREFNLNDPADVEALASLRRIAAIESRERLARTDDETAK